MRLVAEGDSVRVPLARPGVTESKSKLPGVKLEKELSSDQIVYNIRFCPFGQIPRGRSRQILAFNFHIFNSLSFILGAANET